MLLPPRANPELLGHEAAESALRDGLRGTRPHHAWLMTGPRGIGKATLAYRAARWLLSDFDPAANDPASPLFRQIAGAGCPDLRVLERTVDEKRQRLRAEIGVDEVRDATRFLRRTASESGWRIMIIDGAEFLNRNAANALLKTLEEPPARALILLVCQAPQRLLPTIRSRCRTLRLAPLERPVVEQLLARAAPDLASEARAPVATLAGGSIGDALSYAAEWPSGVIPQIDALLEGDPAPRRTLPELAARSDSAFEALFDIGERRLGARIRASVTAPVANNSQATTLADAAEWIDILRRLRDIRTQTEQYNLERRQAIASAISLLSES